MRKLISMFLTVTMLLSLCAGLPLAAAAKGDGTIFVDSADGLIASIAPGAVIQLCRGTIDLAEAASYGGRSGNPYVKWVDCWGGYQLQIHDVDGLVIRGVGKGESELRSECTNAAVLDIQDCTEVVLQDFTAGHVTQSAGCEAGVINLYRSDNISMIGLGLYGCGAWGVSANNVKELMLLDTEIYNCSNMGIELNYCRGVQISRCNIHDIGGEADSWYAGYDVFNFGECSSVAVSDTQVSGCNVCYLINARECSDVSFRKVTFSNNSATSAAMQFGRAHVVFGNDVEFTGNSLSRWYEADWETGLVQPAYDDKGFEILYKDPAPLSSGGEPAEYVPVETGKQKEIYAATVEELLSAIGPNVRIVLTGTSYDLSSAASYGSHGSPWYYWGDIYDGFELVIANVSNFSIVGADGIPQSHLIAATPRYANVINFRNCANVTVQGIMAGHTPEPGYCTGGVLSFEYCSEVLTENCDLYGCGTLGVSAEGTNGLQVINSYIHDCSYGGISCSGCSGVSVGGCTFRNLDGSVFQIYGCSNVKVNGQEVGGNYYGD